MEVGAGGEVLCPEAGAWVVDLEKFDGLSCAVADRGSYVMGVAADGGEAGEKDERGQRTHKVSRVSGKVLMARSSEPPAEDSGFLHCAGRKAVPLRSK